MKIINNKNILDKIDIINENLITVIEFNKKIAKQS